MRKVTVFMMILALLIVSCSSPVQEESLNGGAEDSPAPEPSPTITLEPKEVQPSPEVEDSEPSTDAPKVVPSELVEEDPEPPSNACKVLTETDQELEGSAIERTDCLDFIQEVFNRKHKSVMAMLGYKLYYEGDTDISPVMPEFSKETPAVGYALAANPKAEGIKQKINQAILSIIATTYELSDELGIDEVYIRIYFAKDTYIDVYVTIEDLRNLPDDATAQDVFDLLVVRTVIDGEEKNNSKDTSTETNTGSK